MKVLYLAAGKAKLNYENVIYNDLLVERDLKCDMLDVEISEYDLIIATPPCNYWSKANCNINSEYSQKTKHLLPDILKKLSNSNKLYVVENVINKKRMKENGVFDIVGDWFYFEHGRHCYFTNDIRFKSIIFNVKQKQDFKYGGIFINKKDDRQGGSNVNNVFNCFIKYLLEEKNMNDLEILKLKVEKVELPLVNYQTGLIYFDLSDFKQSINEIVEVVKQQQLNINSVDEFYKLRAKLNNFNKKINDEKKKIKNEFNKPYLDFEKQIKECMSLIESASDFTDEQLKTFEEQQKQILRDEFIELWESFGKDSKVPFERIENQKWYLKSTTKKQVLVEMTQLNEKINNELAILYNNIDDEKEYNAVAENYFKSLDCATELGNYVKWKNTIKNKEIVVEKVVEQEVKTIQESKENVVETKFQGLNQEITHEGKQQQAIISFTAEISVIDYVEKLLSENNIKYNIRRNEILK